MENPPAEIGQVVRLLCQSPPSLQQSTIDRYFALDASFAHPFCRTPSFAWDPSVNLGRFGLLSKYTNSRWLIKSLYRSYKILSPKIELEIDSIAYDREALILYVSVHQVFRIFILPRLFAAPVHLVAVFRLTPVTAYSSSSHSETQHTKYVIQSQEDLYQTNELFKFFSLLRVLWLGVLVWQYAGTIVAVLGQWIFWPVSYWEEGRVGRNLETRDEVEARDKGHGEPETDKPD